jgi:ABC-type bacteriocin/lantibiotic exporter with double-glycine peptidase domain
MADSTIAGSSSSSTPSPGEGYAQEIRLIGFLARQAGLNPDAARIAGALSAHAGEEPLERVAAALPSAGLKADVCRMPLASALWQARASLPLVIHTEGKGFTVVVGGGLFRERLASFDGDEETFVVSRTALVQQLGLASAQAEVEVAFVSPTMPAEGLKGRDDDDHQHDDHPSPISRFIGLMKPESSDIATILIFSLVTGLLYLALPLAINGVVGNLAFGTQSTPFQQALIFITIALTGCLVLSAIIRGLQYVVAEHIQRRIFVRLAADMAWRLPRVRAQALDGTHAPEMVNRFLDVVTVQKSSATLLLNGVNIVVGSVVGLLVLGFYHPFLLAYMFVTLLGLAFVVYVLGRGAIASSLAESRSKYATVGWLEEVARYPRLFKGPSGLALAGSRTDELARDYLQARAWHFRVLMRQIIGLLTLEVVATSALLIVGGGLVLSQQLTLGQLVASELIVSAVVASFAKLGKQFESWYDALAAVDKLGHLVDLETDREGGEIPAGDPAGASVELRDVSFAYPGGRELLSGLSFKVGAGARVAMSGAQGSGCSTLLDLVAAMREPTAGTILVDGLDLRSWDLETYRCQAMVLRTQDILSATLMDNLRLGRPDITLGQVQTALTEVGLLADVLAMPDGLSTKLVSGGIPLSSRQRNRLLVARALLHRPRLLVIDEFLDGMDPVNTCHLIDLVMAPERPWTLLLATRDPQLLRRCPTVIDLPPSNA